MPAKDKMTRVHIRLDADDYQHLIDTSPPRQVNKIIRLLVSNHVKNLKNQAKGK